MPRLLATLTACLVLGVQTFSVATGKPNLVVILADNLGETKNLAAARPEKVAEMKALLETLITDGRSTPGAKQKNDVEVVRHPKSAPAPAKSAK
ncbi:MAG: hypothetical protein EXS41_08135 [Opitutaceae bacterium]|nr:hypothetical protein [Opitutaceae bacterium]